MFVSEYERTPEGILVTIHRYHYGNVLGHISYSHLGLTEETTRSIEPKPFFAVVLEIDYKRNRLELSPHLSVIDAVKEGKFPFSKLKMGVKYKGLIVAEDIGCYTVQFGNGMFGFLQSNEHHALFSTIVCYLKRVPEPNEAGFELCEDHSPGVEASNRVLSISDLEVDNIYRATILAIDEKNRFLKVRIGEVIEELSPADCLDDYNLFLNEEYMVGDQVNAIYSKNQFGQCQIVIRPSQTGVVFRKSSVRHPFIYNVTKTDCKVHGFVSKINRTGKILAIYLGNRYYATFDAPNEWDSYRIGEHVKGILCPDGSQRLVVRREYNGYVTPKNAVQNTPDKAQQFSFFLPNRKS